MRSCIGLFEETGICRSGQPPEELDLRTVIDECFFVEMASENLEEIGNLQRMLCENFAVSFRVDRVFLLIEAGNTKPVASSTKANSICVFIVSSKCFTNGLLLFTRGLGKPEFQKFERKLGEF